MDPIELLNAAYHKLAVEHDYSLRDFSKYLNIDPSTLSKVLAGKRGIPKSHAKQLARKLLTDPNEQELFVETVLTYKMGQQNTITFEGQELNQETSDDIFKIMSEWEYFAILNILKVKNFDHSEEFITKSLNISAKRTAQCIKILHVNNFISIKNKKIERTIKKLKTSNDILSRALKLAHLEELELAKNRIDIDIERKYYQSNTFTIARKDILKVKKLVDKFYKDLDKVTDSSNPEEVYILSSQLFPLSNTALVEKGLKNYEH